MSERRYGLVVPILKNFKGFAELMWSVKEQVNVFVVDNWNHNRGVAAGWNLGVRNAMAAGCTHILVSNDDVILGSRVFSRCADELDTHSDTLIATACNTRGEKTVTPYNIDTFGSDTVSEGPDYSCFMVTPRLFEEVGTFDENIYPAYFEDNDSHHRIKLAGKKAVACGIATMLHRGSQTQNYEGSAPVVTSQLFERNRSYYVRKWGGVPGEEKFPTPYNDPSLTYRDWVKGR